MSHGKEKAGSLRDSRVNQKGESVEFSPTTCVYKNVQETEETDSSRNIQSIKENPPKVISIVQQDTLKLERENTRALKIDQSAVSSNQGDSLDKDDGYLSSSRQTSTRYSSSCTEDNRVAIDPLTTYEKIQGRLNTYILEIKYSVKHTWL